MPGQTDHLVCFFIPNDRGGEGCGKIGSYWWGISRNWIEQDLSFSDECASQHLAGCRHWHKLELCEANFCHQAAPLLYCSTQLTLLLHLIVSCMSQDPELSACHGRERVWANSAWRQIAEEQIRKSEGIPDICHRQCVWRKISTWQIVMCRNSPHQLEKCLQMVNIEKKSVMWRNVEKNLSCGEISSHVETNLFSHNLPKTSGGLLTLRPLVVIRLIVGKQRMNPPPH